MERAPAKTPIDNYLQYAPAFLVYGLNVGAVHGRNNFREWTIIYSISSPYQGNGVVCCSKNCVRNKARWFRRTSLKGGLLAPSYCLHGKIIQLA